MFSAGIRKNNVYPCKPQFYYTKVGLRGSKLYKHSFVMTRFGCSNRAVELRNVPLFAFTFVCLYVEQYHNKSQKVLPLETKNTQKNHENRRLGLIEFLHMSSSICKEKKRYKTYGQKYINILITMKKGTGQIYKQTKMSLVTSPQPSACKVSAIPTELQELFRCRLKR